MQQNSAYPPSNQFNSDSLEQLGPSISGNLQGGMIPMGPPHRQRSGIVYQSPQARPAGLNIHNMNQTDSQSPAIEQWDDQSSWNLANINNAANSFTYHGGHTASQNPLLGNQPPFQTVQGHLSSPTHGTSEFQNKFIADNMDQATNQMLLAQSHTRPNIRGSLLADNKRAPPGLISPAASNAGNITVKVEPGMETTNRDTAGQGRITGSLPTRFSSHASSQSQAPGNSPQPATMQYWFGRLRQQSTSSFQDGLSQENHEPTASVSATTSTALPSAQTHANDQASIGGLAGGDQQYNKYADSDPTFFSQFLNDDEEFGLN